MKVNQSNRCILKGFVVSALEAPEKNPHALEFAIKVPRCRELGKEQRYDILRCYVADWQNVQMCKNTITKGMTVDVRGEIRIWYDGTPKILVNEIKPIF